MYIMIGIRPDIAYEVSLVSRFVSKPSKEDWQTVKWLLRHMKRSVEVVLVYGSSKKSEGIQGYCDSNYAVDLDKRRLLTGYAFTVGGISSVGSQICNILLLFPQQKQIMLLLLKQSKKHFGWRELLQNLDLKNMWLRYIVTHKVQLTCLKIICIIKGQSTLMCAYTL